MAHQCAMQRFLIGFAGVSGAVSVALAAAAAHGLSDRLDPGALAQLRNAVQINGWHTLALLGIAAWLPRGGALAAAAGGLIAAGTLAFCGTVYLLALGGVRLPLVAPLGGTVLILGWLVLAASAFRRG